MTSGMTGPDASDPGFGCSLMSDGAVVQFVVGFGFFERGRVTVGQRRRCCLLSVSIIDVGNEQTDENETRHTVEGMGVRDDRQQSAVATTTRPSRRNAFDRTAIGVIIADRPSMSRTLAMLEPTMLPTAMPGEPASAA